MIFYGILNTNLKFVEFIQLMTIEKSETNGPKGSYGEILLRMWLKY